MAYLTTLYLWTDGGARNNPGPAGVGAVIATLNDNGGYETLLEVSEYIGATTNNQAEYRALLAALDAATTYLTEQGQDPAATDLHIHTDSELMAYQIQGKYKVKNAELRPVYDEAIQRLSRFGNYTVVPVRREQNQQADKLVNQAIDAALAQVGH